MSTISQITSTAVAPTQATGSTSIPTALSTSIMVVPDRPPVPPSVTWSSGLSSEPTTDSLRGVADTNSSGDGKKWLLALIPIFALTAVALFCVFSKLRRRQKENARKVEKDVEAANAVVGIVFGSGRKGGLGLAEKKLGAMERRKREDDEDTLVGKDEVLQIKIEEKGKEQDE